MSVSISIFRHELPIGVSRFSVLAYGIKPLSLRLENDVPVIYEIGVNSPEDNEPWPHHFIWIQTREPLPDGVVSNSYVGTVQYADGRVEHLFQEWKER